jgi:hypothetical protein
MASFKTADVASSQASGDFGDFTHKIDEAFKDCVIIENVADKAEKKAEAKKAEEAEAEKATAEKAKKTETEKKAEEDERELNLLVNRAEQLFRKIVETSFEGCSAEGFERVQAVLRALSAFSECGSNLAERFNELFSDSDLAERFTVLFQDCDPVEKLNVITTFLNAFNKMMAYPEQIKAQRNQVSALRDEHLKMLKTRMRSLETRIRERLRARLMQNSINRLTALLYKTEEAFAGPLSALEFLVVKTKKLSQEIRKDIAISMVDNLFPEGSLPEPAVLATNKWQPSNEWLIDFIVFLHRMGHKCMCPPSSEALERLKLMTSDQLMERACALALCICSLTIDLSKMRADPSRNLPADFWELFYLIAHVFGEKKSLERILTFESSDEWFWDCSKNNIYRKMGAVHRTGWYIQPFRCHRKDAILDTAEYFLSNLARAIKKRDQALFDLIRAPNVENEQGELRRNSHGIRQIHHDRAFWRFLLMKLVHAERQVKILEQQIKDLENPRPIQRGGVQVVSSKVPPTKEQLINRKKERENESRNLMRKLWLATEKLNTSMSSWVVCPTEVLTTYFRTLLDQEDPVYMLSDEQEKLIASFYANLIRKWGDPYMGFERGLNREYMYVRDEDIVVAQEEPDTPVDHVAHLVSLLSALRADTIKIAELKSSISEQSQREQVLRKALDSHAVNFAELEGICTEAMQSVNLPNELQELSIKDVIYTCNQAQEMRDKLTGLIKLSADATSVSSATTTATTTEAPTHNEILDAKLTESLGNSADLTMIQFIELLTEFLELGASVDDPLFLKTLDERLSEIIDFLGELTDDDTFLTALDAEVNRDVQMELLEGTQNELRACESRIETDTHKLSYWLKGCIPQSIDRITALNERHEFLTQEQMASLLEILQKNENDNLCVSTLFENIRVQNTLKTAPEPAFDPQSFELPELVPPCLQPTQTTEPVLLTVMPTTEDTCQVMQDEDEREQRLIQLALESVEGTGESRRLARLELHLEALKTTQRIAPEERHARVQRRMQELECEKTLDDQSRAHTSVRMEQRMHELETSKSAENAQIEAQNASLRQMLERMHARATNEHLMREFREWGMDSRTARCAGAT